MSFAFMNLTIDRKEISQFEDASKKLKGKILLSVA